MPLSRNLVTNGLYSLRAYSTFWEVSSYILLSASHSLSVTAVLEITAKHPAQFVVGRVIVYFSVAFCEVTVTTYQAELGKDSPMCVRVDPLTCYSTGEHAGVCR